MTITARVQSQYFQQDQRLIRLAPDQDRTQPTKRAGTPWTNNEHNRFLEALEQFPAGPWKIIAAHIGTRTTRQTMTHAQKYREKIARRRKAKAAVNPSSTGRPTTMAAGSISTVGTHPCQQGTRRTTYEANPSMMSGPSYLALTNSPAKIETADVSTNTQRQFTGPFEKQVVSFGTPASPTDGQGLVELELDDCVIALLETFEPLEMDSCMETLAVSTNWWDPKSEEIDPLWPLETLFQQCIPCVGV